MSKRATGGASARTQAANDRRDPCTAPRGGARGRKPASEGLPAAESFVAYVRVSTKGQGISGLGLEAQERMIADYLARIGGIRLATFTEVESGKRRDRPELRKALALARKRRATLLVAKLDRLARNVAFVSALMESGAQFRAADFPEANRLMIQILAAVAEYEAKLISDRTKAGLESRRQRGFALGNVRNLRAGRSQAPQLNRERAKLEAERMRPIIEALAREGITSVRRVCETLNDRGYVTGRGLAWHATTVARLLARLAPAPAATAVRGTPDWRAAGMANEGDPTPRL